MFSRALSTTVLAALFIVGCASKPPTRPDIPAGASVEAEIQQTAQMIEKGRQHQLDVLSPKNFAEAEKAFQRAKIDKDKGKANEKVLEQVSYARGWLDEANAKAAIAKTAMTGVAKARHEAGLAGASQYFSKEWNKANGELDRATRAIEKGDLSVAQKHGSELTTTYRDLEVRSVRQANIGKAESMIEAAKKDGAETKAPQTYERASAKLTDAIRVITNDPKNTTAIHRASEEANRESMFLAQVMTKVNAGNTEDLVLRSERQQRALSNLRSEYSSTEERLRATTHELSAAEKEKAALADRERELQRTQELTKAADELRRQFRPNEAEVYTQGDKLMVRLRGLQFASSRSDLGPKNRALLQKVDTALRDINPKKVIVEGHTDATGNPEMNVQLSEKRAQAVEKFLATNGHLDAQLEAVGVGPDKPISDNNSARGRAENRRIDLIIETN